MLFLGLLAASASPSWAQTGKIAGIVTDADTGEPLIGASVVIDGSTQGSTTDVEGYYVILGVVPGTYTLRVSYIGYTTRRIEAVPVKIGQTTTLDVPLGAEVLEGEEIVVTAERPAVEMDVATSKVSLSAEDVEDLPVASIEGAVGLQAGIEGLSIRGGSSDEIAFVVNGFTLRSERDNAPFTGISLAAVEAIDVEASGFNAEYGNVRSGIINVVTREGGRDRYSGSAIVRYSAPDQKHFGPLANSYDSYWIRPYLDPEVAFEGTQSGAWDLATREQYVPFEGWNAIAQQLLDDDDPTNDLTPEALQQAFLWQHRKSLTITEPDYTLDVGVGGPVPGLNRWGDTRFYASYQRDQDLYLVPLSRDRYAEQSGMLKLTTDLRRGLKLTLDGLYGRVEGTAFSRTGQPGVFRSAFGIAGQMDRVSFIDARLFTNDYWAPSTITNALVGAKLTHTLGDRTFYEVRLQRFSTDYETNPGRLRDTTAVVEFGGVGFDEAPFGFWPAPTAAVNGMRMSVGFSNARDTSAVAAYNAKVDLTSQLNRYLLVKTGLEFNLTDQNMRYGQYDEFLPTNNQTVIWDRSPSRGAAYGQAKLEFKGMIANVGLRLDYSHAGGTWYEYDLFTPVFSQKFATQIDSLLEQTPTDRLLTLSPRLGVSFPITEVSKLTFNYGHFRQLPDADALYLVRFTGPTREIDRIADPNAPLPRTVAYEFAYEHALFDQFLVRAAGYYRDISLQPILIDYLSRDGQTEYARSEPDSYEDVRGFELTLARNRGGWVTGFLNYTYMVQSFGYFGVDRIYENPVQQQEYNRTHDLNRRALAKPTPDPYARLNVEVTTPPDFGPRWGGLSLLGDWRLSLIGRWDRGNYLTWTGGGAVPGIRNNVQLPDYWNWDLRLKKNFTLGGTDVQLFADVYNLFNAKRLSFNGFLDGPDYIAYFQSLHLPPAAFEDFPGQQPSGYLNIPGDDRPGDYRREGAPFTPMRAVPSRDVFAAGTTGAPDPDVIYFEQATGSYLEYVAGSWESVDDARLRQILDDKSYINMPNLNYQTFLNPRDLYLGFRVSF